VDEYTWREKALLTERNEVEGLLAEALGYTYDKDYGWLTGDHSIVTLAMEVRRRGILPQVPQPHGTWAAVASYRADLTIDGVEMEVGDAIIFDGTTWMCPHCNDHYGPDDEDQPPVCDMCKKAGRT
jgi:hypothetical protein